ncbi:hypothetical protein DUNSADRAFT_1237 [Dunaliella salina]|uniref:Secreted protein n=1 Tax=Dunaliella salina TaxID=3046 RepID=A0ABQ7FXS6_DUNSA|nr:hypothetical protein DUNSADRAFT_1237 [Dunaliella salina]|eukprot:KAF5827154.1 hypothetical protein DUNSADRAFT_1237 [Dunaliella salina]
MCCCFVVGSKWRSCCPVCYLVCSKALVAQSHPCILEGHHIFVYDLLRRIIVYYMLHPTFVVFGANQCRWAQPCFYVLQATHSIAQCELHNALLVSAMHNFP